MDGEKAMNSTEAAHYLGYTTVWLCVLRKNPDGPPFYRISGARIEYYKSELDAWKRRERIIAGTAAV